MAASFLYQEKVAFAQGTVIMGRLVRQLALVAVIVLVPSLAVQRAQGQTPGAGIGFRNDLKTPVVVQGVSLINNMQRRGQPFLVNPGKTVWDNNLPMGVRYYTIYDANQSSRILLQNQSIRVQSTDQFYVLRLPAGGAGQIKMQQEPVPAP